MLQCTMYDKSMKVKISGDGDEFQEDLDRFVRSVDRRDRKFDPALRYWTLLNPEKYAFIPEVKAALEDRRAQPLLF